MPAWANSTQHTIEISAHAPNTSTQSRIYTISRHVHTERTGAAGQSNFYSPGIVWHDATHSAKFSFPTPDRPTCVLSAVEICGHRTGVEILPSRKVGSHTSDFRLPTSDFRLTGTQLQIHTCQTASVFALTRDIWDAATVAGAVATAAAAGKRGRISAKRVARRATENLDSTMRRQPSERCRNETRTASR